MSDDKQNIDNELAMAILNGLSGPNACKSADERRNKNEIEALKAENARLKAEVDRLRKACELVFNESAKRKFLMCYKGDDFYVSLQAMEAMSQALGYSKAKEGKQP